MGEPERSDYEQNIVDMVEKHGWFCSHVFDPARQKPDFSYSVGFARTLHCPEFIVLGLSSKLMHSMLGSLFQDIKAGREPKDGDRWSDLLEGYDCILKAVHSSNIDLNYFNSARWFCRHVEKQCAPLDVFQASRAG